LITCDIIPGRLKSCSVPFFDLNVELLMRTYIADQSEQIIVKQLCTGTELNKTEQRLSTNRASNSPHCEYGMIL
jgi:hypothetical protein